VSALRDMWAWVYAALMLIGLMAYLFAFVWLVS
jgi:hypothetical protein